MSEQDVPDPSVVSAGPNLVFAGVPDAAVHFEAGHVIAEQFEVVRRLGQGGMGIVYEVQDRLTQQRLALKVMLPSILAKPRAFEAFVREVNVARRLRHPGIVAVYDVRQAGPLMFFTMELLHGQTLRQILNQHKRLSLGKAVGVAYRVCCALDHAHRFTVHRDICPENIMILPDARVYLLDFGIAMAIDAAGSEQELPAGRAFYMAPEQLENANTVDARADIFSLGVIFYEMLTGELPTGYTRVGDIRPELPLDCDKVLRHALGPRDKRYPKARDFARALENCLKAPLVHASEPTTSTVPSPPPIEPTPPKRPLQSVADPEVNTGDVDTVPVSPRAKLTLVHSSQEREWEEWEKRVDKGRHQR